MTNVGLRVNLNDLEGKKIGVFLLFIVKAASVLHTIPQRATADNIYLVVYNRYFKLE